MPRDSDKIIIMSWDIGEKNFCVSKTRISLTELEKIKYENIPLCKRYNQNGECLPDFLALLKKLGKLGVPAVDLNYH